MTAMSAEVADTGEAETAQATEAEAVAEAALEKLAGALGNDLVDSHIKPTGDLWARVATDAWQRAGVAARDVLGCAWFDFLSVIDWLPSPYGREMETEQDRAAFGAPARELEPMQHGYGGGDSRLQVFARLAVPATASALAEGTPAAPANPAVSVILKADVPDEKPVIGTWVDIFPGANWHEREAWEMFGVVFSGHPDLRHIYLPTEFEGHPLRKDFPLLARRVKPWPGIVDVELMPGDDEPDAGEPDADEPDAENGASAGDGAQGA